jgi:NDP-sugar pyrophosphorylase family protein
VTNYGPEAFFDLHNAPVVSLFRDLAYVWDAVAALPAFIEKIIEPEVLGEVEEGAWLEPGRVRLEQGSRVERGAIIRGPTIIGRNTVVRSNAYIRGHVMVGNECLIGCGTEMRQVLVLNQSNIPHLNAFFTSLVGNRVQIGAGTITANLLLSRKEVLIRINVEGKKESFPTGQTLFGAIIGDDSNVGAQALFQPGTVIGRRCQIHPQCSISGFLAHDSIVRPKSLNSKLVTQTPM